MENLQTITNASDVGTHLSRLPCIICRLFQFCVKLVSGHLVQDQCESTLNYAFLLKKTHSDVDTVS